jgi:hypothetical protein
VCNPSTHQLFELPVCGSKIVGFGTGKLDSRVQLVLLLRYLQHTQKTEQSARLGSRTFMEDFHHPVEMFSPPAFANETTYWKIDRSSNHYSSCILKTCCLFWLDTACSKFNSSMWEFVHGRDLRLSHVAVLELKDPRNCIWQGKRKRSTIHIRASNLLKRIQKSYSILLLTFSSTLQWWRKHLKRRCYLTPYW